MEQSPQAPMPHRIRWRAVAVTLLAAGFIASLTLRPAHPDNLVRDASFFCLVGCGDQALRDLLSNILLFLPLGWALRHWTTHERTLTLCLLTTVAIETLQGTVITGRDPSLRDILCNTAGGVAGSWLFEHWPMILRPGAQLTRRMAIGATIVWLAVLGGTARGHQVLPSSKTGIVYWTPDFGNFQRYTGSLHAVQLGDWAPLNGPVPVGAPLSTAMERDSFALHLDITTGTNRGNTLIFAVMDSSGSPQVMVGQLRNSIWMTWRTRFDAWDLRGNTVRIPIFPGRQPGSRVKVDAGRSRHVLQLRASSGDSSVTVRIPESVGLGWNTMAPFQIMLSHEWLVVNAIWLAGLVLPLGYYFGRGWGLPGLGLAGAALVTGLLALPPLLGAAGTSGREWVGGGIGAILGCAAGLLSRRQLVPPQESSA